MRRALPLVPVKQGGWGGSASDVHWGGSSSNSGRDTTILSEIWDSHGGGYTRLLPLRMCRWPICLKVTDVSEEKAASFFRISAWLFARLTIRLWNGSSTFSLNVCKLIPDYTASPPKNTIHYFDLISCGFPESFQENARIVSLTKPLLLPSTSSLSHYQCTIRRLSFWATNIITKQIEVSEYSRPCDFMAGCLGTRKNLLVLLEP
jgi:hypothetical protein